MNEAARQAARSRMNHRPCCVLTFLFLLVSVCSDVCAGVQVESRARSAPPAAKHRRVAERARGRDQATRRHDPTKEAAHSGIQHQRATAATTTGGSTRNSSCDCRGDQRHDEQQHMTTAIRTFLAPLSFSAPRPFVRMFLLSHKCSLLIVQFPFDRCSIRGPRPALHARAATPSLSRRTSWRLAKWPRARSSRCGEGAQKAFEFDAVFGPSSTQAEVFTQIVSLVTSVLDGYACCLFAFGQTGAGKRQSKK